MTGKGYEKPPREKVPESEWGVHSDVTVQRDQRLDKRPEWHKS